LNSKILITTIIIPSAAHCEGRAWLEKGNGRHFAYKFETTATPLKTLQMKWLPHTLSSRFLSYAISPSDVAFVWYWSVAITFITLKGALYSLYKVMTKHSVDGLLVGLIRHNFGILCINCTEHPLRMHYSDHMKILQHENSAAWKFCSLKILFSCGCVQKHTDTCFAKTNFKTQSAYTQHWIKNINWPLNYRTLFLSWKFILCTILLNN